MWGEVLRRECSFVHPQGDWAYLSGSIHEYTWNDGRYMHTYVDMSNSNTHMHTHISTLSIVFHPLIVMSPA